MQFKSRSPSSIAKCIVTGCILIGHLFACTANAQASHDEIRPGCADNRAQYNEPELQAYVDHIGTSLQRAASLDGSTIEIVILNDGGVQAFASFSGSGLRRIVTAQVLFMVDLLTLKSAAISSTDRPWSRMRRTSAF